MAETVLGLAMQNLASLTIEEIKSSASVRKQVQNIKKELESIRLFLMNADASTAAAELYQRGNNEGIRNWVEQVREQAYRIEDVLDEFTFLKAQLHRGTGLLGIFSKINRFIEKLKLRHKIASDIKDIKSSITDTYKRRKFYGLTPIEEGLGNGMQNDRYASHGVSSYYMEEDQIVGNESIRKELIDWLVDERTQRRVFALVGAGGLGKTTLAANVYKSPARRWFDCYAWIEVGKASNPEYVLRKLSRKFHHSRKEKPRVKIDRMDIRELIDLLKEYLMEKRYMVVFDDVRQAHFWKYVEHALLDNGKDNRILITARNRDVVDCIPGSDDHICVRVLEGLPSDKAWELFCRKAFPDGVCPIDLEELSQDLIQKCDGLPLAIVAVGGLLSKKNKVDYEWQNLLNDIGLELERDMHLIDCNRVLCESFNDLPHYLKLCLLYFALFPASYLLKCGRLIRLWIAEGFVQLQDNMNRTLEEVAEGYLTELISRSLVKVSETTIDQRARSVRVHNLMHKIILQKAKQYDFSQVLQEQNSIQQITTRRVTVYKSTKSIVETINDSKVRIFSFDTDEPYIFMSTLFDANIKLMKVFNFEDVPQEYDLPKEVGNIFNLRYLSLRNTKVKSIPKSIGKLFNLETLDLKHTLVRELPRDITNLKKLRYLLVCHLDTCHLDQFNFAHGTRTKIREGIECLTDLQKLTFVEANSEVVQELSKLRQLRKLGVRVTNAKGTDLCASISNMEYLKSLKLETIDREEIIDLQSIASPPQCLELLYLVGSLKKLPDWIPKLQNLVKIHLAWSGLTDDPMRFLHTLPNLLKLSLVEAYNGAQLHFVEGWFPKLLDLILIDLKGLKKMIVDNGALPLLQSLQIGLCPLLENPTRIINLIKLNELVLDDMSKEFIHDVVSSNHSYKVFVRRKIKGNYITEIAYNPSVTFGLHQASNNEKEGKYIIMEDHSPPILPTSQQAPTKDDEEGENNTEKDYSLLIPPEIQQASNDGVEGQHSTKKDYDSPVPHGLQQASKEGKKGKNIFEKDYDPFPHYWPSNKEGKYIITKDYNPSVPHELQQASKDEKKGKNIIAKDYDPVLTYRPSNKKEKHIIKEDYNPSVQHGLQQVSKDDWEGKHVTRNENPSKEKQQK